MSKLINAPLLSKADNSEGTALDEFFILAGADSWASYRNNKREDGKGSAWLFLCDAFNMSYKEQPVILANTQLDNIQAYQLAPSNRKYISIVICGQLTEPQKTAICLNLAINTQAEIVKFRDIAGKVVEDASAYIQRLRNDESAVENAQNIATLAQGEDITEQTDKTKPYIEKRNVNGMEGLFQVIPTYNKNTGEFHEVEKWLCDEVEVVGIGRSDERNYIVLQWNPEQAESKIIYALALEDLGEKEGWKQLKSNGLKVTNKTALRNELADYLQCGGNRTLWTVTNATGWQNGAYILPSGEVIGQPENPVIFNSKSSTKTGYTTKGSAESWREHIANPINKNASMMLALGVGFSAPLISLLNADSFGVHLFEDSSRGKTTTLKLVNSIYGHPKETMLTWNTTDYAMTNEAVAHNNGFISIDEISQGEVKHAEKIAYTLFNGVGRNRGDKDEGNRELKRWSVTALSTGEEDLETMLSKKGIKINPGQLVRLLNIPFIHTKHFHQFENARAHADYLNMAVLEHYGIAGREWIKWLSDTNNQAKCTALYAEISKKWLARPPTDADPQVFRVVTRFAIIETALHLSRFLTGWQMEDISESVLQCFNEWVNIYGFHSKKETQLIEHVNGWLLANAESRFIDFPINPNQSNIRDVAGYRMLETDKNPKEHFFVYKLAFDEAIKGHSKKQACEILIGKGMLHKSEKSYFTTRLPSNVDSNRTRCFLLYPLDESNEEEQAIQ